MYDVYRILTPAVAQEFVQAVEKMEWEVGKARTAEATGTIKRNQEIKETTSTQAAVLIGQIKKAFGAHPSLYADHTVCKVFSPKFNKYTDTGEYQRHGDAAIMGGQVRTDLSCTLFLSHPDTYKGGDLCIENPDGSHHEVKGDPGTCVVYPCHMPHWVKPVTEGARISCVTWFQSGFRDIEQRELMRRFLRVLKEMEAEPDIRYSKHHTTLGTIHGRLQRMWIDYEVPPPSRPRYVMPSKEEAKE
jgi:PKHD-type hydroxylase